MRGLRNARGVGGPKRTARDFRVATGRCLRLVAGLAAGGLTGSLGFCGGFACARLAGFTGDTRG